MKEANENILKTLSQTSVLESVEFLEKFVSNLACDHLIQPTSLCFTNININGEYSVLWANGTHILIKDCELMIKYDLAQYYFLIENYQMCCSLLESCVEAQNEFLKLYCQDFEALLFASKSAISVLEKTESLVEDSLINRAENSVKNNFQVSLELENQMVIISSFFFFKEIFEILIEDNIKNELTLSYRLNMEKQTTNLEIIDQICSCNLVRSIHDDYYLYKTYDLSKLNYISKVLTIFLF